MVSLRKISASLSFLYAHSTRGWHWHQRTDELIRALSSPYDLTAYRHVTYYKSDCLLGTGVSSARADPSWQSRSGLCLLPRAFAGFCPSHRFGVLPEKKLPLGQLQADQGHLGGMLNSQSRVTSCI